MTGLPEADPAKSRDIHTSFGGLRRRRQHLASPADLGVQTGTNDRFDRPQWLRQIDAPETHSSPAGVRYIGSSYGDDANSFKVPSVTLVDLAADYQWENYELQLNVSNLFDKRYVASCFSASAGCFYGEGRKIVGAVRYRW
ncbi:TonB-dependent receptor domain-containing protein [Sinorhizobium fredii]|uniref:TonB-dependent receptor domain-containing protein n=1 Tax=Rhizobium fredii TaxID=380 RepID=UPI003CC926A8